MRKMTRLASLLVCVLLVTAIGTFALAGSRPKLRVLFGGHAIEQEKTWEYIISTFENKWNVDVEYQLLGFEGYRDKLVAGFASAAPPDAMLCNLIGDTGDFAARGWLEPIDDRLATWEGTSQIWPNLWEAVTYEGKRYGIPWYTDARLLMYHKGLFEDAGLDSNSPPETWPELRDYSLKITDPAKGIYGYGVSGTASLITTCGYYVFMLSNGAQVLTPDYKEAVFDSPEGIEALRFYTDLYTKYKVSPPGTLSMGEDEYRTMMAQGKLAMAIGGPWSIPLIETANPDIKGKYAFAVHPHNVGKPSGTFFGGWYFATAATSKEKDLAWKFISHVTSYDTWMYWAGRHGGPLPTREDVFRDAVVYQHEPWPKILEAFKTAHCVAPIKPIFRVWVELYEMTQQVLGKRMTAEEAVKIYLPKANDLLK